MTAPIDIQAVIFAFLAKKAGAPVSILEAERAPSGGINLKGKQFRGGQFIPSAVVANLDPADRKKLDDAKAAAKEKHNAKGSVDHEALAKKLGAHQHAAPLDKKRMGNLKRAAAALHQHHGEHTLHRIEELHDTLTKQLEKYAGNETMQEHLRGKLADLNHLAEMAKGRGVTGAVATTPQPSPPPPPDAGRAGGAEGVTGGANSAAPSAPSPAPTPAPAPQPAAPVPLHDAIQSAMRNLMADPDAHARGMISLHRIRQELSGKLGHPATREEVDDALRELRNDGKIRLIQKSLLGSGTDKDRVEDLNAGAMPVPGGAASYAEFAPAPPPPPGSDAPAPAPDLSVTVAGHVADHASRGGADAMLGQSIKDLYDKAKSAHPGLTPEQFNAHLLDMHRKGQIRLKEVTRAEPRLAMGPHVIPDQRVVDKTTGFPLSHYGYVVQGPGTPQSPADRFAE